MSRYGKCGVLERLVVTRAQGYVLIEYPTLDEAKAAVEGGNGLELLENKVTVDFAFVRPPPPTKGRGRDQARDSDRRGSARGKGRSRSPGRDGEDMAD